MNERASSTRSGSFLPFKRKSGNTRLASIVMAQMPKMIQKSVHEMGSKLAHPLANPREDKCARDADERSEENGGA